MNRLPDFNPSPIEWLRIRLAGWILGKGLRRRWYRANCRQLGLGVVFPDELKRPR